MPCSPFKEKKKGNKKDDVKRYVHAQVHEAFLAAGDTREGQNRAVHEKMWCGHTSIPHFSFRNLLPPGFKQGISQKKRPRIQF